MTPMNKLNYISNLDILSGLSSEQIMGICTQVKDETFDSRYVLYTPTDTMRGIYVVKKGEVLLYHMHNGRKSIFDTILPGDVFGNFSTTDYEAGHFAEATAGTRVCTIPVQDFVKLMAEHPDVMLRTIQTLSDRLHDYESKISMCPAPAKDKVLQELGRYAKKKRESILQKLTRAEVKLTHQKIADLTGLNRVTVTRALQELNKDGFITYNEETGGIVIEDM